jgi:hypothetical protein
MHLETIKAMQEKYDLDDDGLTDCTAFIGMNFTWAPWANGLPRSVRYRHAQPTGLTPVPV